MAKIAQKGMEDIVENTSGVADASVLNWGFKLDATPEGSVIIQLDIKDAANNQSTADS